MQKSAKRYIHAFYEENKLNYVLTIAATIGVSFVQIGLAGLIKKLMDLASEAARLRASRKGSAGIIHDTPVFGNMQNHLAEGDIHPCSGNSVR